MNRNHIKKNITPHNLVTGAHITHIYINQTSNTLNEKSLDDKLLDTAPIEFGTSRSSLASKEPQSLYSGSNNDGKDAVMEILNNSTSHEYAKVIQSPQFVLDNDGTYTCHICINDNDTLLKSVCGTINTNDARTECNVDTNRSHPSSDDDGSYCRYSVTDIDELSDNILNDRQQSSNKVQRNNSCCDYYSSGDSVVIDSEADGIVAFLGKINDEVRIIILYACLLLDSVLIRYWPYL